MKRNFRRQSGQAQMKPRGQRKTSAYAQQDIRLPRAGNWIECACSDGSTCRGHWWNVIVPEQGYLSCSCCPDVEEDMVKIW